MLCIETADRPGLLLEIIKIMADINVNVESAEIDTEVCPLSLSINIYIYIYYIYNMSTDVYIGQLSCIPGLSNGISSPIGNCIQDETPTR